MKLTEIYRNEDAVLEANSEHSFIQLTWFRHASGEPFRHVQETALHHARALGICRWLVDMRRLDYVTIADQLWTAMEYLPAFDLRLHHRTSCVVSPQALDLIPNTLLQEALRHNPALAGQMELEVFLSREEAEAWLFL